MGRVAVLDPNGRFATIDEADLEKLPAGARVLTKAQVDKRETDERQIAAEKAEDERYDALPTYRKVLGGVTAATSALTTGWNPLTVGSTPDAPPTLAAYGAGVSNQITGGLLEGGVRRGLDYFAGKEASDHYAAQVDQQRAASPSGYGLGQLVGAGAGLVSAAGAGPEALAAKGLAKAGVTGTSVLGRAGVEAAKLGVRGAVEGGLMGAGDYVGDALLHDHDLAAEKLFASTGTGALYGGAGGAILGGGGSLLASGSRAGARGIAGALAQRAEAAGGKTLANELAFDALNATKAQAVDALEHVAGGKHAVGEYINRQILGGITEGTGGVVGAIKAAFNGRADSLLETIRADKYGRIATGLSDAVKSTAARFDMHAMDTLYKTIAGDMIRSPAKIAGADAFVRRIELEMSALKNAGKIAADGTISAEDAFYTRAALEKQAYELGKTSGAAGEAYKSFLRYWDDSMIRTIDRAAEAAGKSGIANDIRYWKGEWQLSSAAEKAATGGAERIAHNNIFGLREGIAAGVGLATAASSDDPLTGFAAALGTAVGGKILRERGAAVAAHMLSSLADHAMLSRFVARMDTQIARASKGLLADPVKGALKPADVMPPTRTLARTALSRVAAFQADPDAFVDKATRDVEAIAAHSPEIANGLVTRQVQGMTFLSSKMPVQDDPDPLDPHKAPKMTSNEEAEFGRYAYYVDKPEQFFSEVARGKLTSEGAEVAQALMPRAFGELQQATADALTTQLARGHKLPYRQRLLLGILLDFPAVASQRPEHARFLQQNVDTPPPSDKLSSAAPAKSRRASITPSGSALDRLEANGPGRR